LPSNPNGPAPKEQEQALLLELRKAKNAKRAVALLGTIYSRQQADNPTLQPAASGGVSDLADGFRWRCEDISSHETGIASTVWKRVRLAGSRLSARELDQAADAAVRAMNEPSQNTSKLTQSSANQQRRGTTEACNAIPLRLRQMIAR